MAPYQVKSYDNPSHNDINWYLKQSIILAMIFSNRVLMAPIPATPRRAAASSGWTKLWRMHLAQVLVSSRADDAEKQEMLVLDWWGKRRMGQRMSDVKGKSGST